MKSNRPSIPADVARKLRQEAGYGCAKCGNPIIEYHHIVRWETEQHFRPEDMVVFCPNCHDEADAMTEDDEREYKANPHNIKTGVTEGYMRINQTQLLVVLGSNKLAGFAEDIRFMHGGFIPAGTVVCIDDEPLIKMFLDERGRLQVSVDLYDEMDNSIAIIDRNEWILGNQKVWDFEFNFNYMVIRNRKNDISLTIDARKYPIHISGKLWRKKTLIKISPSGVEGFSSRFSNGLARAIGLYTHDKSINMM